MNDTETIISNTTATVIVWFKVLFNTLQVITSHYGDEKQHNCTANKLAR